MGMGSVKYLQPLGRVLVRVEHFERDVPHKGKVYGINSNHRTVSRQVRFQRNEVFIARMPVFCPAWLVLAFSGGLVPLGTGHESGKGPPVLHYTPLASRMLSHMQHFRACKTCTVCMATCAHQAWENHSSAHAVMLWRCGDWIIAWLVSSEMRLNVWLPHGYPDQTLCAGCCPSQPAIIFIECQQVGAGAQALPCRCLGNTCALFQCVWLAMLLWGTDA